METGEVAHGEVAHGEAGQGGGGRLPPGVTPEDLAYPLPAGYALPPEGPRNEAPSLARRGWTGKVAVGVVIGALVVVSALLWPRSGASAASRARILLERGAALHAQVELPVASGRPDRAALARALNLVAPATGLARTVPFTTAMKHQGLAHSTVPSSSPSSPSSSSSSSSPSLSSAGPDPEPMVAQCFCDGTHRSDILFYRRGDRHFTVVMAPRSTELLRALRRILSGRDEPRLVEGAKTLFLVYGHPDPALAAVLAHP